MRHPQAVLTINDSVEVLDEAGAVTGQGVVTDFISSAKQEVFVVVDKNPRSRLIVPFSRVRRVR